ncbi:MAG: ATP-binding cassette domain-containing protein [Ilumatobacteraceae bacterium]
MLIHAARLQPRGVPPDPAAETADVIVSARGITKSYATRHGTVDAVKPTWIDLRAGEVVGIVGPSGSGKSTLLRLLAGMERPDEGEIDAGGQPMWGSGPRPSVLRPGFAMPVFQNPVSSLDPRWPLWKSLTEPLLLSGVRLGRAQRRERAHRAMASLGLGDIDVERLPGSLSVGQCQRVAVLRALIGGPALFAADEPTASLDVEAATVVSDMLRDAADKGAAVLVVSHDEARLRSYADRLLIVRDGAVLTGEAA